MWLLHPLGKDWFAARKIRDEEALAKIPRMRKKVILQYNRSPRLIKYNRKKIPSNSSRHIKYNLRHVTPAAMRC